MKIDGTGFLNNPLPDIGRTVPGANRALFDVLVDLCAFAEKLKAEIAVQG
jgi:hypothetical protein